VREKVCLSNPLAFWKLPMTDAAAQDVLLADEVRVPEPFDYLCSFAIGHSWQGDKLIPVLFVHSAEDPRESLGLFSIVL
jgi:hypothetical protein